jgi:hypothetical protein
VLLTATFTLALEGMTNITSLTLPAFDASLLAHHTAFGLKRLTFINYTISEPDARALFAWLYGQTNIVSLRFTNLEDVITPVKDTVTVPYRNTICGTPVTPPSASPFTMPLSPPVSPRSVDFQQSLTLVSPFSSPNLLPNLVELYATPSILTLLALPPPQSPPSFPPSPPSPSFPSSFPFPPSPPVLRPLTTVSQNITTTLYTGLRPATLMNQLRKKIRECSTGQNYVTLSLLSLRRVICAVFARISARVLLAFSALPFRLNRLSFLFRGISNVRQHDGSNWDYRKRVGISLGRLRSSSCWNGTCPGNIAC